MWSSHGKNIGGGHSLVPNSSQDNTLWYSVSPEKKQAQTYRLARPNRIRGLPGTKHRYPFSRVRSALEAQGDRGRARAVGEPGLCHPQRKT